MRATLLNFVTIIIIISCNSSDGVKQIDYAGFIEKRIVVAGIDTNDQQTDSLCVLSIKVPARLDTFYQWHNFSCCTFCGWLMYRFADKSYLQFAEDGWTVAPDSVYQLSIRHRPRREAPDTITWKPLRQKDTARWNNDAPVASYSKPKSFLLKEFKLINGRPFIISAYVSPYGTLTNSQTLFIIAETNLKSRELSFIGKCGAKDTTGFIANMYKSFLSIRIEEKQ